MHLGSHNKICNEFLRAIEVFGGIWKSRQISTIRGGNDNIDKVTTGGGETKKIVRKAYWIYKFPLSKKREKW